MQLQGVFSSVFVVGKLQITACAQGGIIGVEYQCMAMDQSDCLNLCKCIIIKVDSQNQVPNMNIPHILPCVAQKRPSN